MLLGVKSFTVCLALCAILGACVPGVQNTVPVPTEEIRSLISARLAVHLAYKRIELDNAVSVNDAVEDSSVNETHLTAVKFAQLFRSSSRCTGPDCNKKIFESYRSRFRGPVVLLDEVIDTPSDSDSGLSDTSDDTVAPLPDESISDEITKCVPCTQHTYSYNRTTYGNTLFNLHLFSRVRDCFCRVKSRVCGRIERRQSRRASIFGDCE